MVLDHAGLALPDPGLRRPLANSCKRVPHDPTSPSLGVLHRGRAPARTLRSAYANGRARPLLTLGSMRVDLGRGARAARHIGAHPGVTHQRGLRARMVEACQRLKAQGIQSVAFGDLHLPMCGRTESARWPEGHAGSRFPLWPRRPAWLRPSRRGTSAKRWIPLGRHSRTGLPQREQPENPSGGSTSSRFQFPERTMADISPQGPGTARGQRSWGGRPDPPGLRPFPTSGDHRTRRPRCVT